MGWIKKGNSTRANGWTLKKSVLANDSIPRSYFASPPAELSRLAA
jgi:hypothetical protein